VTFLVKLAVKNARAYTKFYETRDFSMNFTAFSFITARCYASAVLAMGLCLSVSVCLSQVGVLLKRLNVGSHKQHHTIAQGLYFSDAKDLHEI